MVHEDSVTFYRISVFSNPGLECLHLSIDQCDQIGKVLVYPSSSTVPTEANRLCLSSSTEISQAIAWGCVSNIHSEAGASGSASEFLDSITSMGPAELIAAPIDVAGHTLDLCLLLSKGILI